MSFPSQPWGKMTPNVIKWAPEKSVYLFQIFQLTRKQIWARCPKEFHSRALGMALWSVPSDSKVRWGPSVSPGFSLVQTPPLTWDAEASFLLTPLLCSPCQPPPSPLPRPDQPSLSAGLPPALSSFCVAPGKRLPLMDSTDPWPHFEVSMASSNTPTSSHSTAPFAGLLNSLSTPGNPVCLLCDRIISRFWGKEGKWVFYSWTCTTKKTKLPLARKWRELLWLTASSSSCGDGRAQASGTAIYELNPC